MPRPCAEGQAERDRDGARACWPVAVGAPSETAYLRAAFAWAVAIEAACVTSGRTSAASGTVSP